MKHIRFFIGKFLVFGGEIFYIYLNRRVFVMVFLRQHGEFLKHLAPRGDSNDYTQHIILQNI